MLLRMREQWDAANLTWVRWVLNYNAGLQASLLERILGEVSPVRIAVLVTATGGGFGVLLFIVLMLRNRKPRLPQTSLIYLRLCKKLGAEGFIPLPSETPRHFFERVILSRPELTESLRELIDLYEQLAYGDNPEVAVRLRKAVNKFSPKIQLFR
jgi:hypothetical protein